MVEAFSIEAVLNSALSLFVIMGPFASIPVFISVTKGMKQAERRLASTKAIVTAAGVLFVFLFFGPLILQSFMISIADLRIAGGIVLTILGIELVLGLSLHKKYKFTAAITLLGCPLLSGPGVIVTTMIFVETYGYLATTVAAIIALFVSWLVLSSSDVIHRLIGQYWVDTISRITGLLLVAVAIGFIINGIRTIPAV